ncbi:TniQ family protein [Alcaligenes aquatilis]|uniref:TniQ family protein n=1 Tax=Alcaligenes aquatilis TaxID=323284 RepID=UPI003D1D07C7
MNPIPTPRSVLHALAPIGLGTSDVESLTSYFCRLANSHSCSTNDLAQFVIDHIEPGRWATYQGVEGKSRFIWHQRAISGLGDSALTWASALSELTSQSSLHRLTLLPLQSVIAPKGLMATQSRWCPHCLHDDLEQKKTPYFRLAWDIGLNKVCANHRAELIARCPHCLQSNVRHAAAYVIPGWCTACTQFLGYSQVCGPKRQTEKHGIETQQAATVSGLLSATSGPNFLPDLEKTHDAIDTLIGQLDGGVAAHFARRLGVRKSTVHHWKKTRSAFTLDTLLRCAFHCNADVPALLQGDLSNWSPLCEARQLSLELFYPSAAPHRNRQEHDWFAIRRRLQQELMESEPKSVSDIARELNLDERLLYIQATDEARQLGERYIRYRRAKMESRQSELRLQLKSACKQIHENGHGISMELVSQLVGKETLNSVHNLYTVLSNIAAEAANDDCA